MKILLISNGYPPHRWAGTETYTAGIARGLMARGYSVQALCTGGWQSGDRYWSGYTDAIEQGVPVRRLHLNWAKAPDPSGYLYNNPITASYLAEFLKEIRPDLVHVTSCETLSASILQTIKAAQIPLVLSILDFWFICPRINLLRSDGLNCSGRTTPWECLRCQLNGQRAYEWPRKLLPELVVASLLQSASQQPAITRLRGLRGMAINMIERKSFLAQALRWPDARITASLFTRNIHLAAGLDVPIIVQPYGHDLDWTKNYSGKTPSSMLRIGFIGQIIESKGADLLVQAGQRLATQVSNGFILKIYGNVDKVPEYGKRLRALASGLPNIQFCGTYAHEQSAEVFAGMDVLVVPSIWYDFPLIIYEAFATKTPVITTNLAGMAEAVKHEQNGLLFERGDVDDLSYQLHRIIKSPGLLSRLKAGMPTVKTVVQELMEFEDIYRSLLTL